MQPLICLIALLQDGDPADAVRKALEKTAEAPYGYKVSGKYERTGEWKPPGILTSMIRYFRAARNGERILIKGFEGLWKTPEERLGEQVEHPNPEIVDIVNTLRDAEPPHKMILDLLPKMGKGRRIDDRILDDTPCRAYVFHLDDAHLRDAVDRQINKGVEAGVIRKPDTIHWNTLKSSVRLYVDAKDGVVVRAVDERSVKIGYKGSGTEESRLYRNDMEFNLSGHGGAKVNLPREVMDKLGITE